MPITPIQQDPRVPAFWMKPGISFENVPYQKPATVVRNIPWMAVKWSTPMTVVREGTPQNESLKAKQLNRRKPYWRREYKNGMLVRLNHSSQEVPTFDEMQLGETPVSENMTGTNDRSVTGFLTSLLTQAGTFWQQQEALKTEKEIAIAKVKAEAETQRILGMSIPTASQFSTGTLVVGSLIGLYVLMSQLKK